ncbi:alpha/beta fold hydrolase [Cerasicoccus fimbriatus]|uniref:alpha/beta fold hydrolase n=1 Tax=Cerasicoccus fimbriatus TaxID=3014554 RepID=UPI0022B59538|nr:alpha/beta hydrolase [Cerasicoccus sp. TK19100]
MDILKVVSCTAMALVGLAGVAMAGKVESHYFPTQEALPVFEPPPSMAREYALFQKTLPFLSEGLVVLSVISFGSQETNVSPQQQQALMAGFNDVYLRIAQDEVMRGVPHSLGYSYQSVTPTQGHYYAYFPDEVTPDTRSIVFLHGFGGNFLYYTWLLKEEFPDAIILLPTYTYSWFDGSLDYLREVEADFVERYPDVKLNKPWLFALSAGGPAGFRIYNAAPEDFAGFVCLASAPLGLRADDFRSDLNIYMLNGATDDRIDIKDVRKMVGQFQKRIPSLQYEEVPGDHFFMLTNREDCFSRIKAYMDSVVENP